MEEDAAAEAEVGEGGEEVWWKRKSRPPASRQRCTTLASMATPAKVECARRKEPEKCLLFFFYNEVFVACKFWVFFVGSCLENRGVFVTPKVK
jgi:hypothetical protein